jgi:alcohol dehydrogenase class IV
MLILILDIKAIWHVLQHNAEAAREHYAELAPIVVPECEREGSQARTAMLIDRLDHLVSESGIATRLRDYGIDIAEAPTLAREAMKQTRLLVNNPCEITEADAQRLYEAAW